MKKQIRIFEKAYISIHKSLVLIIATALLSGGCTKTDIAPIQPVSVKDFHLSESKIVLLQGNASMRAITLNWNCSGNNQTKYTIEAAIGETQFAEPIVIGSTNQASMFFSVKDLNVQMSKLLYANRSGMIDLRVKAECINAEKPAVYSETGSVYITTYQDYIIYDEAHTFRIPGNYQNWVVSTAPKIVSSIQDAYEGYINFSNPDPQVMMVKGIQWDPQTTFSYIGADKFGFGGSIMSIAGGAGVYLFKASTATNTWSYKKINSWGLSGTAVVSNGAVDPPMIQDGGNLSWSITTDLVKGNFRLRANNNNAISFGHRLSDAPGIPSYDGDNIEITRSGNYTIRLELQNAGNYAYSIQRNS